VFGINLFDILGTESELELINRYRRERCRIRDGKNRIGRFHPILVEMSRFRPNSNLRQNLSTYPRWDKKGEVVGAVAIEKER